MKQLWYSIIARFFPGTREDYYAGREIHRRESKIYARQPQFIVGWVCFAVPLLVLAFSDVLPILWKLLLLPVTFGVVCLTDTVAEHYCLLLLRRDRGEATPKA